MLSVGSNTLRFKCGPQLVDPGQRKLFDINEHPNLSLPATIQLKEFIEGVTGSVMAIMEGLNGILYENDPNAIPLTDFEKAADMPYDTDIPEGNLSLYLEFS